MYFHIRELYLHTPRCKYKWNCCKLYRVCHAHWFRTWKYVI